MSLTTTKSSLEAVLRTGVLTAAVTFVLFSAPAHAQEVPAPGCAGIAVTDEAQDAGRPPNGAPDNWDITGLFFTHVDGKTYANLQLVDAHEEMPPGGTGVRWYILFRIGSAVRFVRAYKDFSADASFEYGHAEDGVLAPDGYTSGTWFKGPGGVLQIEIPSAGGGAPGTVFGEPEAFVYESIGGGRLWMVPGMTQLVDDTAKGSPYTVGACPVTATANTAPAAPEGIRAEPAAAQLPVTAPSSARARGRSLALALRSRGTVRNLSAILSRGGRRIGRGRLARLDGRGSLKLRLGAHPKPGVYTLVLTGTNPDGRAAQRTVRLRLK